MGPNLNQWRGASSRSIFALSHISDMVNLVLNAPITSNSLTKSGCCLQIRSHVIAGFSGDFNDISAKDLTLTVPLESTF
jgi:CheY-specific phosphatase CheX